MYYRRSLYRLDDSFRHLSMEVPSINPFVELDKDCPTMISENKEFLAYGRLRLDLVRIRYRSRIINFALHCDDGPALVKIAIGDSKVQISG